MPRKPTPTDDTTKRERLMKRAITAQADQLAKLERKVDQLADLVQTYVLRRAGVD